ARRRAGRQCLERVPPRAGAMLVAVRVRRIVPTVALIGAAAVRPHVVHRPRVRGGGVRDEQGGEDGGEHQRGTAEDTVSAGNKARVSVRAAPTLNSVRSERSSSTIASRRRLSASNR